MTLVEHAGAGVPALPTRFDPYEEISRKAKPFWGKAMVGGYFTILAFFGGFGGFAAFAPLHSAIMAPAELRVDNERKVVQHPEGGIVTEILVREGQAVAEGEVLIRLDSTRDNAQSNTLQKQYLSALTERARLTAERDGLSTLTLPPEVVDAMSNPEIAEIVEGERAVFRARRDSQAGQIRLILGQIDQARSQITAVGLERDAIREQSALIEKELKSVKELFDKGLERQPRLLSLQRQQSALKGQMGRLGGNLAQLEKQIGEAELRIVQVERDFQREVAQRMDAVVEQVQSLSEQLPVVSASVRRLDIRAPRAGRIIDLKVHTKGQVIGARQDLMQIVPSDEDLVIIARVPPRDIDELNRGTTQVQVRLTAFSQRFTHPVEAHIESISTDVVQSTDPRDMPYYRAILRLDKASQAHILKDSKLTSGMPAMAMIGVGEKTLLSYLIEPLTRSISDSLREP